MRKKILFFKYLLSAFALFLTALFSANAGNDLLFKHLTEMNGLMHNNVSAIVQDASGFIWIGTQQGLNRFDGYKVDAYQNKEDQFSADYTNRIRKLAIKDHYLWVANHKGLACFDIRRTKYIDFNEETHNSLSTKSQIQSEFIDSKGRIWIGTKGRMDCALITYTPEGILLKKLAIDKTSFLTFEGDYIPSIVELPDGRLMISADDHLLELRSSAQNRTQLTSRNLKLQYQGIKRIMSDGDKLLLVSRNKMLCCSINNGSVVEIAKVNYPDCSINGLAISTQNIWVSTNQGILKIDREQITRPIELISHSFIDPYSVGSNHQSGIFVDNQNNLWVSSWAGGVSFTSLDKPKFNLVRYLPFNNNRFLPSEFVNAIHEDANGKIYVGTKFGGICQFNTQTATFDYIINLKEKLHLDAVVPCITSDENWIYAIISANATSVIRIHKQTKKIELVKSFVPNSVFSMSFDTHHQLWVGVMGKGLACLKIENGKVVSEKLLTTQSDPIKKLSSNQVNFIFNDKQKNELLVSTDKGLNRLMLNNKGELEGIAYYFADKKNAHSLSSNYVYPIDKENDSTYWVGTFGSGLNRISIGKRVTGIAQYKAERFGLKEGAPSNNIKSLQVDQFGKVWCGGRYLSVFNYQTKKFKTFSEENGLQGYYYENGSSCKTKSGVLFFGGMSGMNYFVPEKRDPEQKHKIIFSRIYVNDKVIKVGDTLNGKVLLDRDLQSQKSVKSPYPNNNFKIDFSSLTYFHNSQIQYRYKLEAYDKDWRYTDGKNPQAAYENLPAKSYQFIVQVGDGDQWMESSSNSLELIVQPPWWGTVLAFLVYFILFGLGLYYGIIYFYRWVNMKRHIALQAQREKDKEELMALRTDFFTNVSHEFKTPLTLINSAISEFELANATLKEDRYFNIIKRNNFKLINLIVELMDFQRSDSSQRKLKTKEMDVVKYMREIFEEFTPWGEKSKIELQLTLPQNELLAWVDVEVLTKIISNVISNSLRNTDEGGEVEISLSIGKPESYRTKYDHKLRFFDGLPGGNHLIFSVQDNGVGIEADALYNIFERFQMIEGKKSTQLGSGIGLTLVKSLVKLHKGALIVSSEQNVGTEFVFTIPLDDNYLSSGQKVESNNFNSQNYFNDYKMQTFDEEIIQSEEEDETKQLLLIVDDNQEILLVLNEHFKKDYNILLASDGEEALAVCNDKMPDLIISDVMMPKMDGLELCSRVKSQISTCFIPIVLLTARDTVEQQIEGIDEGADAYIPKPFNLALLQSTVKNLLKKREMMLQILRSSDEGSIIAETKEDGEAKLKYVDQKNQQFVEKLKSIIELNLENINYSIDDLCLAMAVSRTSLYAKMKSITKDTLGDYIREIRMQKTVELLMTTDLPIYEVAARVGFANVTHFNRSFKERFGLSPTEYVKRAMLSDTL